MQSPAVRRGRLVRTPEGRGPSESGANSRRTYIPFDLSQSPQSLRKKAIEKRMNTPRCPSKRGHQSPIYHSPRPQVHGQNAWGPDTASSKVLLHVATPDKPLSSRVWNVQTPGSVNKSAAKRDRESLYDSEEKTDQRVSPALRKSRRVKAS